MQRYLLQSVDADQFGCLKYIYFLNTYVDVMNLVAVCSTVIEGKTNCTVLSFFGWGEMIDAKFYKLLKSYIYLGYVLLSFLCV